MTIGHRPLSLMGQPHQDVAFSVIHGRILHEINATGGNLRRICELFRIKVETAWR